MEQAPQSCCEVKEGVPGKSRGKIRGGSSCTPCVHVPPGFPAWLRQLTRAQLRRVFFPSVVVVVVSLRATPVVVHPCRPPIPTPLLRASRSSPWQRSKASAPRHKMAEVAYDSYMNDSLGGVGGAGEGGYMDEYQAYGTQYSQQKPGDYVDDGEDLGEITQQGCWEIITAFFEENGLVQQQLSSFNEFVSNTVQELVEESKSLTLEQSDQHTGLEGDISVRVERARWRWEQTLTSFFAPHSVDLRLSSVRSTLPSHPSQSPMDNHCRSCRKKLGCGI